MLTKFCEACGNISFPNLAGSELKFVCRSCGTKLDGSDSDALLGEIPIPGLEGSSQETMIRNAPYDITNLLIDKKCPKCKDEFLTFMYTKFEEMRPVETCKCGYVNYLG